ncbi:hypothetical protein QE152_g255 [Popillia japonica]|uniref:Uncharacterized protein n=1 Tax=Popillia japonica TaxID=7064 RepID=A0AAW1NJU4_POPJA
MSLGIILQTLIFIELTVLVFTKELVILHSSSFEGRFSAMRARSGMRVGGLPKLQPYLQKHKHGSYIMVGGFVRKPYSTSPARVVIESELMQQLNPIAVSLGPTEFNLEIESFMEYTASFTFPVVSTNFDIRNCKVDYVTDDIIVMSYAPRSNLDEMLMQTAGIYTAEGMIEALKKRIKFHKNNTAGKKVFIATGCDGINTAIDIAENVPGINVVLSGCSKTMQWNEGEPPEYIRKDSEYPLVYETKDGRTVLIPHTYGM